MQREFDAESSTEVVFPQDSAPQELAGQVADTDPGRVQRAADDWVELGSQPPGEVFTDVSDDETDAGQTTQDLDIIESDRLQYMAKLKNIRESQGDADLSMRRDLQPTNQSLLQLAAVESISSDFSDKPISHHIGLLDKVPFSQAIGEVVGYRPQSIVFAIDEYPAIIPALDDLLNSGAVYVKANKGFRGENVTRIEKTTDNKVIVASKVEQQSLDSIADYAPREGYLSGSNTFIAEQEIPIAPTSEGGTWEARMLPPFSDEYSYSKTDNSGSGINNISQGGERRTLAFTLEDVIRAKYPTLSGGEVAQKAESFIDEAKSVAAKVKDLSDDLQVAIAKNIIKRGDLKDSSRYDGLTQMNAKIRQIKAALR